MLTHKVQFCRTRFALIAAGLAMAVAIPQEVSATEGKIKDNVLTGRVIDHKGQPVSDAEVIAANAESGYLSYGGPGGTYVYGPEKRVLFFFTPKNAKSTAEVKTGSDGKYSIRNLQSGKYNLVAVHEEKGVVILQDVVQGDGESVRDIQLLPPTFIRGKISGFSPSESAVPEMDENPLSVLSSANMMFWTDVTRCESWPWETSGDGFLGNISVDIQDHELRLDEDHSDGGRVQKFGPLPGGGLWKVQSSWYAMERSFSYPLLEIPVEVELGKTAVFHLDASKGTEVKGTVVGPDGKPLQEVAIALKSIEDGKGGATYRDNCRALYGTLCDKKGHFVIRGVPDGKFELTAERWAKRTRPG